MLLGFISLLLTVFQGRINTICISKDLSKKMLPCKDETKETTTAHFQTFFSFVPGGISRRLLAEASSANSCSEVTNNSFYMFLFFSSLVVSIKYTVIKSSNHK
jgi:mlo protein